MSYSLKCEYNSNNGGENVNKIKMLREKARKTQTEIAERLDVDKSTVSKWETGGSLPRAATLIKLAEVLNCTVDELLDAS